MEAKSLRELFSKRSRWIKGHQAKTHNGLYVGAKDDLARKFCLWGGLKLVYTVDGVVNGNKKFERAQRKLERAIKRYTKKRFDDVVDFNDHYTTHFTDIQKVLKLAKV